MTLQICRDSTVTSVTLFNICSQSITTLLLGDSNVTLLEFLCVKLRALMYKLDIAFLKGHPADI